MRSLRLLIVLVVAVFASVLGVVASASAATIPLPSLLTVAAGAKWTGANIGETTFEAVSELKVVCKTAAGEGSVTAANGTLGPFHITFKECTGKLAGITAKCTGLGDPTEGLILVLGTWHNVIDVNSPELHTAILFLLEEVHFECSKLLLVKVKGSVLCLYNKPLEAKETHEFTCEQTKGVQKEKKYFTGVEEKTAEASLEQSTNEGAFEQSAQGGTGTVTFAGNAVKLDD